MTEESDQQRAARAADLELERVERATALRVETALKQRETDYRLTDHDSQLKAINGSIKYTGQRLSEMRGVVDDLADKFDGFVAAQRTRDEVAAGLRSAAQATQEAAEKANEQQISKKVYFSGVAMVIVTIVADLASHIFK